MTTPHPSHQRLMRVIQERKGPATPAEISRWITRHGFEVSHARLNNWKSRGIPEEACLHLARALLIDPVWLYFGEPRHARREPRANPNYASEPEAPYDRPQNREIMAVISMMIATDDIGRGIALGAVSNALSAYTPKQNQRA